VQREFSLQFRLPASSPLLEHYRLEPRNTPKPRKHDITVGGFISVCSVSSVVKKDKTGGTVPAFLPKPSERVCGTNRRVPLAVLGGRPLVGVTEKLAASRPEGWQRPLCRAALAPDTLGHEEYIRTG